MAGPDHRHAGGHVGSHLGGEIGDLVPRQQVAAESETQHQAQQRDAAEPGQFARPPVGVREDHAEHVHEGGEDHQVGGPAMDRPDQPAELHAGHDELHAVEGFGDRGPVVEQQQDAR